MIIDEKSKNTDKWTDELDANQTYKQINAEETNSGEKLTNRQASSFRQVIHTSLHTGWICLTA